MIGRMEQVHLTRVAAAVLADVLDPAEAETNVLAHVDSLRIHAEAHGISRFTLRPRARALSNTPTANRLWFSPQRGVVGGASPTHLNRPPTEKLAALFV